MDRINASNQKPWKSNRRSLLLAASTVGAGLACQSILKTAASVPIRRLTLSIRKRISPDDIAWLPESTRKQLCGCRLKGAGGAWLHTPDGSGNYGALWTRDFQYMVEDVIADFRRRGIMECVNGDYHAVRNYVASATNVYGLLRGGSNP